MEERGEGQGIRKKDCDPEENLEDKTADNSDDGAMMDDSDDKKKGAYMSAAEGLSLSPIPNNYETPEGHGGEAVQPVRSCRADIAKTADNSDDDEYQDKFSYRCLKRLDRDFFSSPRLIVAGIWRGEGLEMQAKRRTEGTWVEWILKVMKT